MTHTELTDDLIFLAAIRMLVKLVEQNLLNSEEANQAQKELRRRLRPTILACKEYTSWFA